MVGWLGASRTLGGLVAGEGPSALRHSRGLGCRMPERRVTLLFSKRTDVPDRDPNYRNAPMSPTVTKIIETHDAAGRDPFIETRDVPDRDPNKSQRDDASPSARPRARSRAGGDGARGWVTC